MKWSIANKARTLAAAFRLFPLLLINGFQPLSGFLTLPIRFRFRKRTFRQRLADFQIGSLPLDKPVQVRFDQHQIPFITGETDHDVAFALGMVHAHLRLGQMEITRRIAQGRLAEIFGPPAANFDHSLRCLDLDSVVPALLASLPTETLTWMTAYVEGINTFQNRMRRRPLEFKLLRIPLHSWTVSDILVISRLAGADVNWVLWLELLGLRRAYVWRVLWGKILDLGFASPASFTPSSWDAYLPRLLGGVIRSGSNSFAASQEKSRAFLASDPHLSILFPNLWILVGYRSPSFHVVGFMLPGMPFTGLGRNPKVAWGATNMYAASSDLVDVGELPPGDFSFRQATIKVRGWFPRVVTIRSTKYGPVISDAPFLVRYAGNPISLRWIGHAVSDEISAFLGASRAQDWPSFKAAFSTYAVSGMNVTFADASGNVGQLMAARLPKRKEGAPLDLLVSPAESDQGWAQLVGSDELPSWLNPPDGFVVSANNRPATTEFPVGYLYPPGDRHRRIRMLLEGSRKVTLERCMEIQADVHSASCDRVRSLLCIRIGESGAGESSKGVRTMLRCLSEWDGTYRISSRGAAAFQLMVHAFAVPFLEKGFGKTLTGYLLASEAFFRVLEEELVRSPGPALLDDLRKGTLVAYASWRRYPTWGILHRIRISHPLRVVPFMGRFFVFGQAGTGGSAQTVLKSSHPVTGKPHFVTYGAVARHISDLSLPDENYFALLGGQDGWMLSENSLDLWEDWKHGTYIRLPLSAETVPLAFPYPVELLTDGSRS